MTTGYQSLRIGADEEANEVESLLGWTAPNGIDKYSKTTAGTGGRKLEKFGRAESEMSFEITDDATDTVAQGWLASDPENTPVSMYFRFEKGDTDAVVKGSYCGHPTAVPAKVTGGGDVAKWTVKAVLDAELA